MGLTWGPPESCRPQVGPILALEPCYLVIFCLFDEGLIEGIHYVSSKPLYAFKH